MSLAGWEAALSRMEDDLDRNEQALRTGNVTRVPEFEAPEGLGPLPPQLAERVRNLVRRTRLLETFVHFQLVATDADLRYEQRTVRHPGAQALYLDRAM